MNDIFNIRRFGKYFASDVRSCIGNYGLGMLLISLMGLITYAGTIIMGLIFNGCWDGPELGFRVLTFLVCLIVLVLTMPVKCYGRITEKKFGSQWLMIPASSFEKSLSMVIMTSIVMPVAVCIVYFGVDALLCTFDKTCGTSIFASIGSLIDTFMSISVASSSDRVQFPDLAKFIKQVSNPWLYVDDIIGMFLITLTGAVLFKSGKTAKTCLAYIAITFMLGIAVTPFANAAYKEFADLSFMAHTPEAMNQLFSAGIFRHAALIDTINDTIFNLALIAAIYFRVKTLKH